MLGKGCDRNVLDADGDKPLRLAAKFGYSAVAQALLDYGADASLRCAHHFSALDWAAPRGHVGVTTALAEHGMDVNAASKTGLTPLHSAAVTGEVETASLLLTLGAAVDASTHRGSTPLMLAADGGHSAATQVLLAAGANATLVDGDDLSALDKAAKGGHVDAMNAIIAHGVDVNAAGSSGFTVLDTAVMCARAAAIDVLVAAGARIDRGAEPIGRALLHTAARMSRPAAALALLKHGASVDQRNVVQNVPLHSAAANAGRLGTAEVVDLLLRHGADEKAIDNRGRTPADVVGNGVDEHNSVAEDVERVRQLLANAPADKAWRRRGFLVLCRAHYPGGRVQLGHGSGHPHDAGTAKRTRSRAGPSRAEAEWAGVASMLMRVGADPISLMGDGANIIFETIVGFL